MEPISRHDFAQRFGAQSIIGMIHLRALPGAPAFSSIADVLDLARRDAAALQEGGVNAIMMENFGDRPFFKRVPAETIAAMSRVIADLAREISVPFGVNVLRNDGMSGLAIAAATGASFIRINVLTGAMLTDQGVIEGDAATILRERKRIAPNVLIFADHMVKHAVPVAPIDPLQSAKDLRLRAYADAIVVSGKETGAAVDTSALRELRAHLDAPLVIGSGCNDRNASELASLADAAIVGSSIKKGGRVDAPVEVERVKRVVSTFRVS